MAIIGGDWIDPKLVRVEREKRQRREIVVDDLLPSIRERGVINPIVVKDIVWDPGEAGIQCATLVAGERRLTACLQLGLDRIPYREAKDLSLTELEMIELEENTKRVDLSWQDMCKAHARIYEIHKERNPQVTYIDVAAQLNMDTKTLSKYKQLADAIHSGDKAIAEAAEISNAWTILQRRQARALDATLNEILTTAPPALQQAAPVVQTVAIGTEEELPVVKLVTEPEVKDDFKIVHSTAEKFFAEFTGQRFNLIHCDFPYGVALNGQANQGAFEGGGYDSNPDIYWHLCRELAAALPKLVGVSAHIMFWISMKFYEETLEFFREAAPQIVWNPTPFIWHKTDNKGVVPDVKRMPRNVYEAALIGSIGDRMIVKPVANCYGAPTNKSESIHTNEKPEAMLKHFLSMFVDEHTVALDPTCGSGSAIRAIEALGGRAGVGVEFNPEFAARSQERLKAARTLKFLSEKTNG